MIYHRQMFALLLLATLVGAASAQEETNKQIQGSRLVPPSVFPEITIDINDVALAKVDKTGKTLRMIVPRFTVKSQTREVSVTKCRQEQRTRLVEREDGEKIEQAYTVSVPYTEIITIERAYRSRKAGSEDRIRIPIEQVTAWQLDGTLIEAEELRERAAKPLHFIATRNSFGGLPTYFREALNPEIIVVYVGAEFADMFPETEQPSGPPLSKAKD